MRVRRTLERLDNMLPMVFADNPEPTGPDSVVIRSRDDSEPHFLSAAQDEGVEGANAARNALASSHTIFCR